MRDRDRRDRPRLSETLRRNTEARWTDDPRLGDADGGPVCEDCGHAHDDHHHHDFDDDGGGTEWV